MRYLDAPQGEEGRALQWHWRGCIVGNFLSGLAAKQSQHDVTCILFSYQRGPRRRSISRVPVLSTGHYDRGFLFSSSGFPRRAASERRGCSCRRRNAMSSLPTPYPSPAPIRSGLFKNPPESVPPTDELESLHAELKILKQKTLERAKKAGEDLRIIEESMRRIKEKEKGKARAVEKVKKERGCT